MTIQNKPKTSSDRKPSFTTSNWHCLLKAQSSSLVTENPLTTAPPTSSSRFRGRPVLTGGGFSLATTGFWSSNTTGLSRGGGSGRGSSVSISRSSLMMLGGSSPNLYPTRASSSSVIITWRSDLWDTAVGWNNIHLRVLQSGNALSNIMDFIG